MSTAAIAPEAPYDGSRIAQTLASFRTASGLDLAFGGPVRGDGTAIDITATCGAKGASLRGLRVVNGEGLGGKTLQTPAPAGLPPLQMVDRNELHRVLHDHALAAGVPFEYDKRLVRVAEGESGVTAYFADGSSATADVLIGADGVRSTVRGLIDPANPGPEYTGMLGFGALIDNDLGLAPGSMVFAFGQQAYYLYGTLDEKTIMWGANLPHKEYLSLTEARALPAEHWLKLLRETYGADSPGGEFARRTTPENLEITGALHIMPSVPRWHRGRLVLVGDAVHAPSNSSGQGASLAVESAIQLARCLRDLPDHGSAFAAYEELRRTRVESVAARARKLNHSKTPGPLARRMMSVLMPMMIKKMDPEKTLGVEQRYRIDWDAPVQPELVSAAG